MLRQFVIVMTSAIVTSTCAGFEVNHGRQVLLNRGLQIQALTFPTGSQFNVERWQSSNFTAANVWDFGTFSGVLEWLPVGSPWSRMDQDNSYQIPTSSAYIDSMVSLQYWDEKDLTADYMNRAKDKFAQWRTAYPNTIGITNMDRPQIQRSSAIADFLRISEPDMLSFDFYPDYSFGNSERRTWYTCMSAIRTSALAGYDGTGNEPVPYSQFLNTYRDSYSDPIPSESYIRLQQNASWAFGFTSVEAFIYTSRGAGLISSLFSSDGDSSPTAAFDYIATTNQESLNLSPALVRLVSREIRMIPGSGASVSGTGVARWEPGSGSGDGYTDYITSITPIVGLDKQVDPSYPDTLIGYLSPLLDDNRQSTFTSGSVFMIVNGAASGTAWQSTQWYRVAFDFAHSGMDKLARLSRTTGKVENVPLTWTGNGTYFADISLPGGTGDLFCFYNGATLPTIVPEPGTYCILLIATVTIAMRTRLRRSAEVK